MSVDYLTRLEQGRSRGASPQVIDAVAQALNLDEIERLHLNDLAFPVRGERERRPARRWVHSAVHDLLETFDQACQPAFVLGRHLDVLAWNSLAARFIVDFAATPARERNAARLVVLAPHARQRYRDWDSEVDQVAGILRLHAGRHPDDMRLAELIDELVYRSQRFARAWSERRVHRRSAGTRTVCHPLVGDVTISYQALTVNFDPDQTLYVYRAEPDSPSATALERLRSRGRA